jgi:hypothetical protein
VSVVGADMSALIAAHLCDVHCCAEVTAATLALVKAFLAIRVHKEFKRPKRPLIAGGDLAANGVDAEWIAFVDGLSDDQAFALLRAGDALLMEDLQVGAHLEGCDRVSVRGATLRAWRCEPRGCEGARVDRWCTCRPVTQGRSASPIKRSRTVPQSHRTHNIRHKRLGTASSTVRVRLPPPLSAPRRI